MAVLEDFVALVRGVSELGNRVHYEYLPEEVETPAAVYRIRDEERPQTFSGEAGIVRYSVDVLVVARDRDALNVFALADKVRGATIRKQRGDIVLIMPDTTVTLDTPFDMPEGDLRTLVIRLQVTGNI